MTKKKKKRAERLKCKAPAWGKAELQEAVTLPNVSS